MISLLGKFMLSFLISLLLISLPLLSLDDAQLPSPKIIFILYYLFLMFSFWHFLLSRLNLKILLPPIYLNLIVWMLTTLVRWWTSWSGLTIHMLVMPFLLALLSLIVLLILSWVSLFIPSPIFMLSYRPRDTYLVRF